MNRTMRQVSLVRIVLSVLLCSVMGSGIAWAHDEAGTATAAAPETIHPLTVQLLKLADALSKAEATAHAEKLAQLRGIIEARREALLALMGDHPDVVLTVALPEAVRKSLPADVQGQVEQDATLEGTLEIDVAMTLSGGSRRYPIS